MLLEPLPNAGHGTLVRVWSRVRSMEDPDLIEQDNCNSTSFPLRNLCSEFAEQTFNVLPLDVGTRRMGEDRLQRALRLALHRAMVLQDGTVGKSGEF